MPGWGTMILYAAWHSQKKSICQWLKDTRTLNNCDFFPHELLQMHLRSILILWQLYTIMHYLLCYLIFQSQHTLVILLSTLDIVSSQLNETFLRTRSVSLCSQMHFSVQFSSVAQLCLTLFNPMGCSMPGLPVHHQFPQFGQTHVHWVGDAIQPSHPLSPPSPPAFNLSQHQSLFKWVSSSHQVAKVLEFQLQHQSFQWIFRTDFL